MKFSIFFSAILLFASMSFTKLNLSNSNEETKPVEQSIEISTSLTNIYNNLEIPELNEAIFELALKGYYNLWQKNQLKNEDFITIVDFTQPSNQERLFLIDLKNKKVIDKSLVAHGKNTGQLTADYFSNIPQSYQSSLGFYLTAETYIGKHGYSLRLDGVEQNYNDKARERAIVIHGADYVSHEFCAQHGRLGRSFGCPSLPQEKSKTIINTIKEKSCLFIYSLDENYLATSALINTALPNNWWSEIFE